MDETVHSLIYEKIAEGENWLSLCKDKLANVPGIDKLIRKVTAEVKFLKRVSKVVIWDVQVCS